MSSNLKVNTILPSTGDTVSIAGIASITSSVSIASSCTATTFFGSGANLTNLPAGITINTNADNRIITGSGTANTLNAEANLVFDGNFGVGTNSPSSIIHATGSNTSTGYKFINTHTTSGFGAFIKGGGTTADRYALRVDNAAGDEILRVSANKRVGINEPIPDQALHIKDSNPFIELEGTTNNSGDVGIFLNANGNHWLMRADNYPSANAFSIKDGTPASSTHRLTVAAGSGNVTLNTGNLIIGTSGKGIDFSATGDSAGNQGSSELLDDYEEGSWTPAFRAGNNSTACPTSVSEAKYTRVGRLVTATAYFTMTSYASGTTGGDTRIVGLPYQNIGDHGGVSINYWWSLKQNVSFMAGTVQGGTSEILIRATTSAAVGTDNIDFDNTFGPSDSLILTAIYYTS